MDWRTFLIVLLKGALKLLADELSPPLRRRAGKEAPQPPQAGQPQQAEQAKQSAYSTGWAAPSEPPPVTVIRVETDAGSTIAAASFIGDECFGVTRVERERRPGESRRVRRRTRTAADDATVRDPAGSAASPEFVPAPRHPRMVEFAERMRQKAGAEYARQQEAVRRAAPKLPALKDPPAYVLRTRRAGEPMAISQLAPGTLTVIEVGERLRYTPRAA